MLQVSILINSNNPEHLALAKIIKMLKPSSLAEIVSVPILKALKETLLDVSNQIVLPGAGLNPGPAEDFVEEETV